MDENLSKIIRSIEPKPDEGFTNAEYIYKDSNILKVWGVNKSFFYLYNLQGEHFIRRGNLIDRLDKFVEISTYSSESKSFVAKKWKETFSIIAYEDGNYFPSYFEFVGEEYNNFRPEKSTNKKWGFFDTKERKIVWEYNFKLEDKEQLFQRFNDCYFSVKNDDSSYRLGLCKLSDRLYVSTINYFNRRFESIVAKKRKLICKWYDEDCFTIFDEDKDKFTEIVTLKGNNLIIYDKYIFIKDVDNKYYKIYNLANGTPVILPTDWSDIRLNLEDGNFSIIINTSDEDDARKTIEDLKSESNRYMVELATLSLSLTAQTEDKVVAEATIEPSATKAQSKEMDKTVTDKVKAIKKPKPAIAKEVTITNNLPKRINYFSVIKAATINKDSCLQVRRSDNKLSSGDQIVWYITDYNTIAVTTFRTGAFHVCYYRKLENKEVINIDGGIYSFIPVYTESITEENLVESIKEAIDACTSNPIRRIVPVDAISRQIDKIMQPKVPWIPAPKPTIVEPSLSEGQQAFKQSAEQKEEADNLAKLISNVNDITNVLKSKGFEQETIDEVLGLLYPRYKQRIFGKEKQERGRYAEFIVDDKTYCLEPNEEWNVSNPFVKKGYLRKKDCILILINKDNFDTDPASNDYQYNLKGQGMYTNFDQDIDGQVNKPIHEKSKKVLLFTKNKNNAICFYDEVEYQSHDMVRENGREIIQFHMKSLIRKR
jgi:hypothetical protein